MCGTVWSADWGLEGSVGGGRCAPSSAWRGGCIRSGFASQPGAVDISNCGTLR